MAKTILIVNDSESNSNLVRSILEKEGYNVLVSVNGKDALEHMDGQTIDLVITDLQMPEMDGIELIKNIRAIPDYERIPILLLTTESQTSKKMEAKEAGATGWIIKPFVPAKLISAIGKVIK